MQIGWLGGRLATLYSRAVARLERYKARHCA
jgi:hypothetical protein